MTRSPSIAELRAIGDADVPAHGRVRALLAAHGLPHGRRARRRFYGAVGAQPRPVNRPFLSPLFGALFAPRWYLRWLVIERPWRRPERWRWRGANSDSSDIAPAPPSV